MAKSKKLSGANDGDDSVDGYDVGYRKPPKSRQFKPGQSGNPGGRKKGSVNINTVLAEVLGQKIEISENGKKQAVTIKKALMLRWVQEGLKGHVRAIEGVYDRTQKMELTALEPDAGLAVADAELLERYVQARVEAAIAALRHDWANASEQSKSEGDEDV